MYTIHATRKLLDRVKQPVDDPVVEPSTALGNWYATAIFWKPQVALFVNERTLLPVFVPLAPATGLAARFPEQLGRVLEGLERHSSSCCRRSARWMRRCMRRRSTAAWSAA